jgi:DNA mismatch repair protein MutL
MPDLIRLLPDDIANQIAAGEVVQRPASVVKELLENALDAKASKIVLIFRDGGQTSIQVNDNGKGMSDIDARMSWERHATSKIERADDLFRLHTFGFRGEALASIAAVAQVEMKTRRSQDEFGTLIAIEASEVKKQEPCACQPGTSITVKNLFFNIPARRNFLKSMSVESRHIIDAFQKIALSNPQVEMELYNNDNPVYQLKAGSLLDRIEELLGHKTKGDFLELNEQTDIVSISGYLGSPDAAKRTRGEQYFYANGRFIRSPYFQHAISSAFEGLMDKDHFPTFVLFIEVDPSKIDVNIHPTKTEVKFEESLAIYSILKSVSRKALGKYHRSPEIESSVTPVSFNPGFGNNFGKLPEVRTNPSFNPFGEIKKPKVPTNWEKLYEPFRDNITKEPSQNIHSETRISMSDWGTEAGYSCIQISANYLACTYLGELLVVQILLARERILYEKYQEKHADSKAASQQLLFPRTVEFNAGDFALIHSMLEEINNLGFDVRPFGKNTLIVNGTPADVPKGNEQEMLEGILASFKYNEQDLKLGKRESLLRSMARNASLKIETSLSTREMNDLVHLLFKCKEPAISPSGRPTFVKFASAQLEAFFKR